mgnify:CR=1 FL=1
MARKKEVTKIIEKAREEDRTKLTEYESKQLLSEWEIPVTETKLAKDKLEAVDAARELKYPVVMKISSPDIDNKTEAEGIRIGISSEIEVRQAFEDLKLNAKSYDRDAEIEGVVVQEYVPDAREVVIGVIQDPSFGPTMTFGLGGVWVDKLKDMSYRLAPISGDEARDMIEEIEGYPLLSGSEGGEPVDIDSIVDVLKKTSEIPIEFREISEIALTPVFAFKKGKGSKVVEAQITLQE